MSTSPINPRHMQEQTGRKDDYWGRYADAYDNLIDRIAGEGMRRNLATMLEGERITGNVIELGCGTGYFTRAIAKSAGHVTATDLSPEMIAVAKKKLKGLDNVSLVIENGEATSFPPESFDAALLANMLHTLDHPEKALEECHRILKADGTLLIINYTDEGMGWAERTWMYFRFALRFGLLPKKSWPITQDHLRSMLTSSGFRLERMDLVRDSINSIFARAMNT